MTLFLSLNASAQGTTAVSGVVKDPTGATLPGVTVLEKGTTNAVSTDFDGNYTIKVAGASSELVFSYIGFETTTKAVGNQTKIDVVLSDKVAQLDEVVVIGYGSAKKSDLTGAVSTISGDALKKVSMPSVAETLTGRVAGVQVTSSEGSPDADIKIRIRGGGSITQDSSPLVIVDGFPVSSISDISPNDIDQITVLKDASSTAIYGSRGANGVIIITTKSGTKDNKLAVTVNSFFGMKKMVKTIGVTGPQDYADWQYEYALLTNDVASYEDKFGTWSPNAYATTKKVDWQKEIFGRTGTVQSHDIGLRGGSDKLNYSFNYTRYDEKAIMLGSDYKRDNISMNLKNKPSDKVNLNFTLRYSDTKVNGSGTNEQKEISSADSRLKNMVGYAPMDVPGLTTDNTDEAVAGYLVNPYVSIADNDRQQERKNINMLAGLGWTPVKNLQFKSDFGLDNYFITDNRFYGRSTYYVNNIPAADYQGKPALIMSDRQDSRFRNANTLNYDFKDIVGDKHNLNLLVGEEMINYQSTIKTSTIHNFPDFFTFSNAVNLSAMGTAQNIDNYSYPEDKLLSFFGRLNYDFDSRYLLTATYRADGSSKFLGDNRWGYFPSAAAAWKISSEEFMKNLTWVNLLKLRLSYGQAGNNNIPVGQTIQTFLVSNSTWINDVSSYLSPSKTMANPDLKWETTITQDLGLDFELFKGKLNGSVDVYKNVTKDLLINFPVAGSGYDTQYRNMGETQNTGIEGSLNYFAIDEKDYALNFSFNITANKSKINSLGIMDDFGQSSNWASTAIGNDYAVRVGQPVGIMYGYKSDGRYEVSDFTYDGGTYTLNSGVADATSVVGPVKPGMMKLKDINGDGVVNADDQTIIGNANPKFTGGFVLNANAYGFDLMAAFNWSVGNDIYNANKVEFTTATPNTQYRNLSSTMASGSRWTNVDASGQLVTDPSALSALNENTTMWSPYMQRFVFSDWAVEDGSFLRLNTLSLGYSLPAGVNQRLGISRLRFYTTCNNVFVLTNYSGPDPEVSTRRATPLTPGVDYSAYPRSRQFVFGLNLSF
ncbi:SusC/RagA family TonB-linked outer membrane protein [Flavobacterium sp. RHBU_3]|uniref:SusC/RagA family TonB-linked outer membrane protein n=1 Tax=Flavobacterium sp. RHBU_3 TaxID=3391184 RepID=UPI0039854AFB